MSSSNSKCKTVSVVMILDEADHALAQALSCFSQQSLEHHDFEVLLVGPAEIRPSIGELIERYTSLSIRFLSAKTGGTYGSAFNIGVQNARGDLILVHDCKLFADKNLLEEHLKAHQLPSNEDMGVFSTVMPDPTLPPYLFNEGLRRANFLPRPEQQPEDIEGTALQGITVSLRKELFSGENPLRFSESDLSRWGVEREFIQQLKQRTMRLARHPHACCLQRGRETVDSFTISVLSMTRDAAFLAKEEETFVSNCPTVKAFDPSLLPHWREHLDRDAETAAVLRDELFATEGLIARRHADNLKEQTEFAISRIAECILLFREHLAQLALVEFHEATTDTLAQNIETEAQSQDVRKELVSPFSNSKKESSIKTH